ncbi:MAG: FUSC family protein [Candidatus Nanopelagicales bacterium]
MLASTPPKAMRTTVRTPGTLVRDISRSIQKALDSAVRRAPEGSLSQRLLRSASRSWATAWLIGITAIAACTAWVAALLLGIEAPVPAAAGAVITVALSLNRSMRTGLSLVGATAAALLVAFALYQWWGLHVWTVGVLVIVSLVIGRLLRLGPEGSLQIPVTALFVYFLGEALTNDVIVTRIVATLLGVAIGLAFSFVAHPERPEERMTEQLSEIGGRLGALLVAMGHVSGDRLTRRQSTEWLTEARALAVETRHLGGEIEELGLGRRFSVGSERAVGRAILDQYSLLQQTSDHVNSIARGLFDATSRGSVRLPEGVGQMLSSTGEALSVHADSMERALTDSDPATGVLAALEVVEEERTRSVAELKEMDDTGALLLGGSLVNEVDQMAKRLAGSSGR